MPPDDDLQGLGDAAPDDSNQPGVVGCKKKPKHYLKVLLTYKDDGSKVKAAKCQITQGDTVVAGGPLSSGVLSKSSLVPGTYEVSFPDIDASEWGPAA
jgi:hypothetical protein